MSKTLSEVTRDAAELGEIEKLKLARILLSATEVPTQPVAEIDAAWDQEIERRLEELRSGRVKGIPLDKVRQRIEAKFGS